jgi:putative DNA primase/helicase
MTRTFYEAATGEQHTNATVPPGREAIVIEASTITSEEMNWIWPGRLAVGALTNCVGLPDQGKSLIFTDLTARLTVGSPMPPSVRRREQEPQRVLILTLEDSLSRTLVPRLMKAGADLELVDFVQMVRNTDGQPSLLTLAYDLDVLGAALDAKRYALVVVDGITGYLGDAKTHNDADVRRVLAPFVALLDRVKVAGLSVMHTHRRPSLTWPITPAGPWRSRRSLEWPSVSPLIRMTRVQVRGGCS